MNQKQRKHETEENSQANLKDDRSSNFATNKDKDINDFNHTTKIKNKITHKSALDEMTQQTEHHEARKEGEERQASTPKNTLDESFIAFPVQKENLFNYFLIFAFLKFTEKVVRL